MPINMGTLLLLQLSVVTVSPTLSLSAELGRNLGGLFRLANDCGPYTCQFTQCYDTSDALFDAKFDTDNAGELLETPTELRCSILMENKGNPASNNSRTYTAGWKNRLKTTRQRRAANFSNKLYKCV